MSNFIAFISAMGLQLILVACYVGMVLSIKFLIRRCSPVFCKYLDQIKESLQKARQGDPGTHHPG